jgi:hypothetical protein
MMPIPTTDAPGHYFLPGPLSPSRFNYSLTSGAIEPKELCADFSYPVELMSGTPREMKLKNTGDDIALFSIAVHDYLTRWEYPDINEFQQKIQKACRQ